MKGKINFNPTCGMIISLFLLIAVPTIAKAGKISERNAGLASKTAGLYLRVADTSIRWTQTSTMAEVSA